MDKLIIEQSAPGFGTRVILEEGLVSGDDIRMVLYVYSSAFMIVLNREQVKEIMRWMGEWVEGKEGRFATESVGEK